MHLHVEQGGTASEIQAGAWTIFPIGWPGPATCFGVVQDVGPKSAMVWDVFFGMSFEFMLDRIEVLDRARLAELTPAESTLLEKARRKFAGADDERLAA